MGLAESSQNFGLAENTTGTAAKTPVQNDATALILNDIQYLLIFSFIPDVDVLEKSSLRAIAWESTCVRSGLDRGEKFNMSELWDGLDRKSWPMHASDLSKNS